MKILNLLNLGTEWLLILIDRTIIDARLLMLDVQEWLLT